MALRRCSEVQKLIILQYIIRSCAFSEEVLFEFKTLCNTRKYRINVEVLNSGLQKKRVFLLKKTFSVLSIRGGVKYLEVRSTWSRKPEVVRMMSETVFLGTCVLKKNEILSPERL